MGDWTKVRGHKGDGGRTGPAYRACREVVRERARAGEGCWFCHRGINLELPKNHRMSFTMHHIDRLMDGGPVVPDPLRCAPAHRCCNASDSLRQQNARRAANQPKREQQIPKPPRPRSYADLTREPVPVPAALLPGGSFRGRRVGRSRL